MNNEKNHGTTQHRDQKRISNSATLANANDSRADILVAPEHERVGRLPYSRRYSLSHVDKTPSTLIMKTAPLFLCKSSIARPHALVNLFLQIVHILAKKKSPRRAGAQRITYFVFVTSLYHNIYNKTPLKSNRNLTKRKK